MTFFSSLIITAAGGLIASQQAATSKQAKIEINFETGTNE